MDFLLPPSTLGEILEIVSIWCQHWHGSRYGLNTLLALLSKRRREPSDSWSWEGLIYEAS